MEKSIERKLSQEVNSSSSSSSGELRFTWKIELDFCNHITDPFNEALARFEAKKARRNNPTGRQQPPHQGQLMQSSRQTRVCAAGERRLARKRKATDVDKERGGEKMYLGRLAAVVRGYLEHVQGPAAVWDIYKAVGMIHFGQRWHEQRNLTYLKRRICEVLRVFEGLNLIYA